MKKNIILFFCLIMGTLLLTGCRKNVNQLNRPKIGDTVAEISVRNYGAVYFKLFAEAAPKAVENFVTHAQNGYYDGLEFYRIVEDSIIEGGDPTESGNGGESIWGEAFKDEFNPDLQPYHGALCMSNGGPDTNGSRFFIVQASRTYNSELLDQIEHTYNIEFNEQARKVYSKIGGAPWFYHRNTVFGQVYKGYDVLDKIAAVKKTDTEKGVPAEKVIIDKVIIFNYKK